MSPTVNQSFNYQSLHKYYNKWCFKNINEKINCILPMHFHTDR